MQKYFVIVDSEYSDYVYEVGIRIIEIIRLSPSLDFTIVLRFQRHLSCIAQTLIKV